MAQYANAYLGGATPNAGRTVRVDLERFDVHDFEAHAGMRFTVTDADRTVLESTYDCPGKGYAARVIWGGAFAMKSSTRKTIDEALRSWFEEFLAEARRALQLARWAPGTEVAP